MNKELEATYMENLEAVQLYLKHILTDVSPEDVGSERSLMILNEAIMHAENYVCELIHTERSGH